MLLPCCVETHKYMSVQSCRRIITGWLPSFFNPTSDSIHVRRIVNSPVMLSNLNCSVRAVINLEAAGSSGRELLFQATSQEMIDAYSRVPRPYGSIFANEIFSSGIIMSEWVIRCSCIECAYLLSLQHRFPAIRTVSQCYRS